MSILGHELFPHMSCRRLFWVVGEFEPELSVDLGGVDGVCFGEDGGEFADLSDDGLDLLAGQSWSASGLACGSEQSLDALAFFLA